MPNAKKAADNAENNAANLTLPGTAAVRDMAKTYAEVAQRASRLITEMMDKRSREGILQPHDELGIAKAFMDLSARLMANPYKVAQTQMNMMWDYFSLWQGSMMKMMGVPNPPPVATPCKGDQRFRNEEWENHFLFDFIKQSYLIAARSIHDTVSGVEGLDEHTQQKVNFFTRQYIDAISPSNFALTNPEVFNATFNSNGQNLIKGFNNLLRDIDENGKLHVRTAPAEAFVLGQNVANTPGKVIFENEYLQLIQYTAGSKEQYRQPILIIPPWINKYYIFDLRPNNSLVKWLTDQGYSVFIISWVNPDKKMANKTFADYLLHGALAAVDAVCEQSDCQQIQAMGCCLGGTLLATLLAYCAEKKDTRIQCATFLSTMLDFSEPGELGVFMDENTIRNLEKKMHDKGYLDGREMNDTFNMLKANDLIWSFVVNNYLLGKDPYPFDLLYWNSDSTRLPAELHGFYLRNMCLQNKLQKPGGIQINNVAIDLRKIKIPCFFFATLDDHITPWKSVYNGAHGLKTNCKFVVGGAGHVAGIINSPSDNKFAYWINPNGDGKLPASADEFFTKTQMHSGSWWPHWHEWLLAQQATANKKIPARNPEHGKLKPIEDAPGRYVQRV